MFPFKHCSFTVWLACFVQHNSLTSSRKKLEVEKKYHPPSASVLLQVLHTVVYFICDSFLIDQLTSISYYSMRYFGELFIVVRLCVVLVFFSSSACWYIELFCEFLWLYFVYQLQPSPRPESPVLWVYFLYTFSLQSCSLLFHINLPVTPEWTFSVFSALAGVLMFLLDLISFTESWFCFDISV